MNNNIYKLFLNFLKFKDYPIDDSEDRCCASPWLPLHLSQRHCPPWGVACQTHSSTELVRQQVSGCADFLGIAALTQKRGTVRITPGLRFLILQWFLVRVQTIVGLAFHLLITLFHMFILKCSHFSDFPGKDGSLFTFREGGPCPDAMDSVQTQWFFCQ